MNWISYAERKPEPVPKRQVWVKFDNTFYGVLSTISAARWSVVTDWAEIEGPDNPIEKLKESLKEAGVWQSPLENRLLALELKVHQLMTDDLHDVSQRSIEGPGESLSYEGLKREISSRSISQLPGLLQHVARLCGIRSVFKDKESLMDFTGRAYNMGPAGEAELRDPPPPDPFEEAWKTIGCCVNPDCSHKNKARAAWDAAIKWKEGK